MKQTISIIFLLFSINLFSQQEYKTAVAKGKIPTEIISMNKAIYDASTDTVTGTYSQRVSSKEFLLQSNYQLGDLLKSGTILFGDEFTNYVTKIGNKLIELDTSLNGKIHFYVVKSPEVNAFATQQGYLFVNMGLLAQVENEAQLAFVIAHELTHYKRKHIINSYIENETLIHNRGKYRNLSNEDSKLNYLNYSKENEFEADKYGFEDLYLKTGYDVNEAISIFDVLLYSYLPVDEITFDTTFFNDEYFKLPSKYFKKKTAKITAIEDYDDTEHYHPNIKKRREVFLEYIAENEIEEGKKYVFPEDEFKKIQKDARYELSNLYTINTNYGDAIYNTYILMQKNKDDIYLEKNMVYNLYALSKYETYHSVGDVLDYTSDIEGKSQQVFSIFNSISDEELNVLSLKSTWRLYKKTNDKRIHRLYIDLLNDLASENELYFSSFKTELKAARKIFEELSDEEYEKLSKYEKIKYDKKLSAIDEPEEDEILYSMVDLMKDEEFTKDFEKISKKYQDTSSNSVTKRTKRNEYIKTIEKPIDSILIVNPVFSKYDVMGKKEYVSSEEREFEYIEMLKKVADKTNITYDIIDIYTLNENDIDKFNQLASLNSWVSEFSDHQTYDALWSIFNSQDDNLKDILKTVDKQYINLSGAFTKSSMPKSIIQYYFIIDGNNGRVVFSNYLQLRSKDYDAPVKSFLYDSFSHLKSGKQILF